MSRAGSGRHALAPWRACLLRHTSEHAFILAGTTRLQIGNSARACLHAHKIRGVHTFLQTHLARENACKDSLSTARRLCKLLHLGACQGRGWGKEWRNRAHAFPFEFPLPPALLFLHKSVQAGVSRRTGERKHVSSLRAALLQSPGTCTTSTRSFPGLAPPSPSARALQGRTLHSCGSARAACSFLPVLPPPVGGPERAPAVNSPGTPLGAGGRARSPPPDPAPPHPAQAVARAAAEHPPPAPPAQPESTLLRPRSAPSAAAGAASLRVPQAPSCG